GMFGSVKMLSYTMAGRVMLTLSRGDIQITFIAAEDGDPRMGIQGLQGKVMEVRALVDEVIRVFETELIAYDILKDDSEITIH
ncbi:MAG: hypothetical protein WCV80_03235, partial [Candidatus Paceibacterota bacterium]